MQKYTSVADFLDNVPTQHAKSVTLLRSIINTFDVTERIKWNAPSYVHNGEDRITFNMHSADSVRLILHCGATLKEDKTAPPVLSNTESYITWNSNIRATLTFDSYEQVASLQDEIRSLLKSWLALELPQ